MSVLVLAMLVGAQVAEATSPSPLPSALPPPSRETIEKCQDLIKEWALIRASAKGALEGCNFAKFQEFCKKTAEARGKVVVKGSPCMSVPQIRDQKLPEINCEIIKVPESCGQ
jgi:hypothetical protein